MSCHRREPHRRHIRGGCRRIASYTSTCGAFRARKGVYNRQENVSDGIAYRYVRNVRRGATPEEGEAGAAAAGDAPDDADADAALEARLARIRSAGVSRRRKEATASPSENTEPETILDFRDEKVFFEGPPSRGDLAVNVALGATLLWLPLTFAAVGRSIWLKYRITDKRISIISSSPTDSTLHTHSHSFFHLSNGLSKEEEWTETRWLQRVFIIMLWPLLLLLLRLLLQLLQLRTRLSPSRVMDDYFKLHMSRG